jgi:hypothetical protein
MINNYLSTGGFNLSIRRLPNVEFFTQKANIPGITSSAVQLPAPTNPYFEVGDTISYEDLDVSFIIDEDMKNYMEVFKWLTSITAPQNSDQYKDIKASKYGLKSEISLIILNSHENPVVKITYYDCFPVSLSSVQMDINNTDVTYAEGNATFKYNYYTVEFIGVEK